MKTSMLRIIAQPITIVWIGLLLATCLSWEAVEGVDLQGLHSAGGTLVVAIAFLKTRFIMLDFMELRHAPLPMRLFAEVWWFGIGAVVISAMRSGFFGL